MDYPSSVSWIDLGNGVQINAAAWTPQAQRVLTPEAQALLARLHRHLEAERQRLLAARATRQAAFDAGTRPAYLPDAVHPAARTDWQIAPLPEDLLQRRVEITGPVSDAKMVINMLSRTADGHRADCAMLDFEDSMKPSWTNVMQGVENIIGAVHGTLTHVKRASDGSVVKTYRLDPDDLPVIMARVRGLHLDESNVRVDGTPVSGALLDFALCALHTARAQVERGRTPKYYVPKVEHYEEARWYNTLMTALEEATRLPHGTIKATFLIETLPAAYQMEEILYEFRDHAAGLNGGRWDKIFSDIKTLRAHPDRVMADRATIGMNRPWMSNYARQLIRVCHRHGAFGMGGMAAFTPGRTPERREEQTAKVVADKEFEARIGHDGCWVSHPYFIGPALEPFAARLAAQGTTHQLTVLPDVPAHPDLMPTSEGPKTLAGLRTNVRVGIAYMKGWQQDIGCVAWDDLMEDLATLEISRAQTWQWLHNAVSLDDGPTVTRDLVLGIFDEELTTIRGEIRSAMAGASDEAVHQELGRYERAAATAAAIFTETEMRPFLTTRSELIGAETPASLALPS
ncbi:MAG: malate synthase A [Bacteroidota bacterium]